MLRVVVATVLVLLAGCGGSAPETAPPDEPRSTQSPRTESPSSKPPKPRSSDRSGSGGTRLSVSSSDFGPMLFDGRGQAIYLFDAEVSAQPRCYEACATAWPPVLTDGRPVATGAARDDLLGTTRRADGSVQVTYGGHPLYFYAHEDPGQVLCHDVEGFGGLWLVVTPAGDPAPH